MDSEAQILLRKKTVDGVKMWVNKDQGTNTKKDAHTNPIRVQNYITALRENKKK